MGHTPDASDCATPRATTPATSDEASLQAPAWALPGQRPGSVLSAGVGGAGLVPKAAALFAAFATSAEQATLTDQVVAMRHLIDRCEALWLGAAAELDSSGAITEAGFGTLASWLRHTCRLAPGEASGRAKVATAVTSECGATAEEMLNGRVTWRHALVIDRALAHVPEEHRDEAERSLVEHASALDPGQLRQVGDRMVHCFDRERADEAAIRRLDRRGLSVAETMDGMVSVYGLLDPVTGSLLMTALNTKLQPLSGIRPSVEPRDTAASRGATLGGRSGSDEVRTWSQRRADALAEICQEWLQDTNDSTLGGVRPHLSVVVDHATLAARVSDASVTGVEPAQLAWVGPITATEAQMIGCDATVSRIVTDGASQILDVGRATRTIPLALRRAVAVRDHTCVGPGCHRAPEHCDVHHVVFWEHGGETSLSNTVLLCRRHHGLVHLKQWRVVVEPDGTRRLLPP